jgi:hypothetical protein
MSDPSDVAVSFKHLVKILDEMIERTRLFVVDHFRGEVEPRLDSIDRELKLGKARIASLEAEIARTRQRQIETTRDEGGRQ